MKPYEGTEAYKAGFEDGRKPNWISTKYTLPPVPMCSAQEKENIKKPKDIEWIPCTERLPELPLCSAAEVDGVTYYISDPVLVTTADGQIAIATMEMPEDGPHGWDVDGILVEVIAWMPLPEPWEREEE